MQWMVNKAALLLCASNIIYVNKTIKGVTEGRNEFLEKALEVAKKPMWLRNCVSALHG